MNQNINPLTAFLIVLTGICLIGLIFWMRGESLEVGGSDQMQFDPEGNVVIHIADKLYRLSPALELQDQYDLDEMGVYELVGDFAFFSNGDLLVRKGKYEPGLLESFSRYLRIADTKLPKAKSDNEGLFRCRLTLKKCSPFGLNRLDFDSAFHLSIDKRTDIIYLSDTSRHTLRKFDAQGNELAVSKKGFKFPNQNSLHNNKLLVVDTNHHAIQHVDTETESFGEILESHPIVNPTIKKSIWPYSFAKVGKFWWVNSLSASMSNGTIGIYDENWQYLKTVKLPADADPFDFSVLDEQVLVTDLNNNRIYQLDYQGQSISNSLPAEITQKLEQLHKDRLFYIYLSYGAVGLFAVFLIAGFAVGMVQARNQQESTDSTESISLTIDINDPDIRWVTVNKQKIRLLKLMMLSTFFILLIGLLKSDVGIFRMSLFFVMIFAIIAVALTFRLYSKRIGILDDILIIKKYNKVYAAAKQENIFFSDTQLLTGSIYIPFSLQHQFFNTEQIIKEVMPLLRDATYVDSSQMMSMILKRQNPKIILLLFLFIIVGIVAIVFNGIRQ